MSRAIRMAATGGPEVLLLQELAPTEPGPGELLVKVEASGVNFIDVYHREGRYARPMPFVPGQEGAGVVQAVGREVADFKPGQRVAWANVDGAYAELAVIPAVKAVLLPEGLDSRRAAAAMLQGMTAHFLSRATHRLAPGDTCLVHAAAGGVGLLLTQLAKRAGAQVIATVSTPAKAELAREAGADHVVLYTQEDFVPLGKKLGCDVVYDSVGKDTFERSLACLKPRGLMVLYGASSGAVPPFDPIKLSGAGSLFLTRPTLGHYTATRKELLERAGDILGWIADGSLKLRIEREYPLADAAQAHRDLEARKTTGKLLLIP